MTKPKTQEQLDRETDRRLLRTYGIDSADKQKLEKVNFGGCWACGSKPVTRGLHIDHDHGYKKIKVTAVGLKGFWSASARYNERQFTVLSRTKNKAIQGVRKMLKRASVRGLLCFNCNLGVRRFRNSIVFLTGAVDYLKEFETGNTDRIINGLDLL